MKNENFYDLHADLCKTISNPRRQAIIDTIRDDELTVNEMIKKTGIAQANLSQHLAILRAKGVVHTRREGNNVFYSLSNPKIIKAYDLISEVLKDTIVSQNKTIKEMIDHNK
jgi:ArsR family transcriptional regulator